MFYNTDAVELRAYRDRLKQRKIKRFSDENWYMWGRKYYESNANRIYVNSKTRQDKPFFYHDCKAFDGSVLAIFPKFSATKDECEDLAECLNAVDWKELGFVCDGRYLFTQKSLENCVLPDSFSRYLRHVCVYS
jgi:adenine-specific DNA-methyltransferase